MKTYSKSLNLKIKPSTYISISVYGSLSFLPFVITCHSEQCVLMLCYSQPFQTDCRINSTPVRSSSSLASFLPSFLPPSASLLFSFSSSLLLCASSLVTHVHTLTLSQRAAGAESRTVSLSLCQRTRGNRRGTVDFEGYFLLLSSAAAVDHRRVS